MLANDSALASTTPISNKHEQQQRGTPSISLEPETVQTERSAESGDSASITQASFTTPRKPLKSVEDRSTLGTLIRDVGPLFEKEAKKWDKKLQEDKDLTIAKECDVTGITLPEWLEEHSTMMETSTIPDVEQEIQERKNLMGMKKKPIVKYTVSVEAGLKVTREYPDFVALHAGLVNRFPGMCIPPLPSPKHPMFGAPLLAQFLACIRANPFLMEDPLVAAFLSGETKFDVKLAKTSRQSLFHDHGLSAGAMRWSQTMLSEPTPANAAKACALATERLGDIKTQLASLISTVQTERARVGEMAQSSMATSKVLEAWGTSEGDAWQRENALHPLVNDSENLVSVVNLTASAHLKRAEMLEQLGGETYSGLEIPLAYEALFVEAFLDHLKKTQPAIKALHKATSKLQEAKNKVDTKDTKAHKQQLFKAGVAAVRVQIETRPVISGVLGVELRRFTQARAQRMTALLQSHNKLRMQINQQEMVMWESAAVGAKMAPPEESHVPGASPPPAPVNVLGVPTSSKSALLPTPPLKPNMMEEPERAGEVHVAIHTYAAQQKDELSVEQGDEVQGWLDPSNPEWFKARHIKTGRVGFVPSNYFGMTHASTAEDDDEHTETNGEENTGEEFE